MVTTLDRFHCIALVYWAAVAYLEVTPGGLLGPPPLGGSGGMHTPLEILRNIRVLEGPEAISVGISLLRCSILST